MWVWLRAYLKYEDGLNEYQKVALNEYQNYVDCISSMEVLIRNKVDELSNKFNLDIDCDVDLTDDEDDPSSYISFRFDDSLGKAEVERITLLIRDELLKLSDSQTFEIYTDRISGGYPSYDPPEYATMEVDIEYELSIYDKVEFE